jgi:hypothetical protein
LTAKGPLDVGEATAADFTRRLGEAFALTAPDGEGLALRLVEVTPHPHAPPTPGRRRGFSIVFVSDRPRHLPQSIYRLEHDGLGTLELFLVPIGTRDGGIAYEAVFN